MRLSSGLRTVALLEASKGALVLLAGFELLSFIHRDVQAFAERLILHAHLNPAARYPRIFLRLAGELTDGRLWFLAGAAAAYAVARFIEAYGLWYARRWAEWFAALSGAIYIPFELFEVYRRVDWLNMSALLLNAVIVVFMLYTLRRQRRVEHSP